MLTDYENKAEQPEFDENGKRIHKAKIMMTVGGRTYYQMVPPGGRIKDRSGRLYEVMEDGSLRRIKENK